MLAIKQILNFKQNISYNPLKLKTLDFICKFFMYSLKVHYKMFSYLAIEKFPSTNYLVYVWGRSVVKKKTLPLS